MRRRRQCECSHNAVCEKMPVIDSTVAVYQLFVCIIVYIGTARHETAPATPALSAMTRAGRFRATVPQGEKKSFLIKVLKNILI